MNPKDLKKPSVSEELAMDLAYRLYGLRVTSIKRMVSYDDQNFHIKVEADFKNPYINGVAEEGYTLKVTNTEKSSLPGHFDSMHGAMMHLNNKGLKVPVPVLNIEGRTWTLEKVPLLNGGTEKSDGQCGIHLLTFVPGQPVSTVTSTRSLLHQWGSLLARCQNAAEDLSCPHLKKKNIFWNLEHVMEIKNFIPESLEPQKKDLVMSVLNQYPDQIEKNLSKLRKGIIHGDFNENNILLRICEGYAGAKEPQYSVEGILDFEDMHYGTYVWDVGVFMAYSLLDCETIDPLEGAGHALAGYLSLRTLDDLELSLLKMCIACRLCQSLVLGAYSYSLDPSNAYIIISARSGWKRLEQIWSKSNEDLLRMWKDIQKQYHSS